MNLTKLWLKLKKRKKTMNEDNFWIEFFEQFNTPKKAFYTLLGAVFVIFEMWLFAVFLFSL